VDDFTLAHPTFLQEGAPLRRIRPASSGSSAYWLPSGSRKNNCNYSPCVSMEVFTSEGSIEAYLSNTLPSRPVRISNVQL
jgi:hypothetical protein